MTRDERQPQGFSLDEAQCRALFEGLPVGVHLYRLDAEGRLLFQGANPAADRILGLDNRYYLGRTIQEAFPALRDTDIPAHYVEVVRTGQPWQREQVEYKDDRISGAFAVHAVRYCADGVAVYFRDITEQKRTDQALKRRDVEVSVLYALSLDIAAQHSIEGVKQWAFDSLVRIMEPDLALFYTAAGQDLLLEKFYSAVPGVDVDRFAGHKLGECLCGLAAAKLQPVYSLNIHRDERCSNPECKASGIQSFVALPLLAGGRITGILALASLQPKDYSAQSLFLESMAGIFSGVLHNAALHENLRRSMTELERSHKNLRLFIDSIPFGVLIVGQDRTIRQANRAALQELGFEYAQDIVGLRCHDTLCVRRQGECPILDLGKHVDRVECDMRTRDGRLLPVVKSAVAVRLDDESVLIETFVEISDIKKAREILQRSKLELEELVAQRTEELQRANESLKDLDRLKSAFLDTVSHDLRTPLTSILGFAKMVRRSFDRSFAPLEEESPELERRGRQIRENLDIIAKEGERLTRLINDVLDISRIEEGRYLWQDQPLDLVQLIRDAAATMSGVFMQKPNVRLEVRLPESLPLLTLDPDRMAQVLVNLLSNAAKFTEQGMIQVGAEERQDAVLLWVADTGAGIPETELQRIFDRFYQVGQDTLGITKGTGLGLAICKQIVEHYHGSIWAESELGVGTKMYVQLPLR